MLVVKNSIHDKTQALDILVRLSRSESPGKNRDNIDKAIKAVTEDIIYWCEGKKAY